jgi:hypothetical protein
MIHAAHLGNLCMWRTYIKQTNNEKFHSHTAACLSILVAWWRWSQEQKMLRKSLSSTSDLVIGFVRGLGKFLSNQTVADHSPSVRPTMGGSRVKPCDIEDYRSTHQMNRPSCLCPMIYLNGLDIVESTIRVCTTGPFAGEYVATCAREECGYPGYPAILLQYYVVVIMSLCCKNCYSSNTWVLQYITV